MAALTGAFLDIAVVENYGDETEETETLLGKTTDDITLERDPNEIEWNEHNNPRAQRKEGFESATTEFSMVVTDDQQNLIDAGIMDDTTGEALRNVTHEAVYIHVYDNAADEEPAATYFAEEAQFVYQETEFPMDGVATVLTAMWINGPHGFKQDTAA